MEGFTIDELKESQKFLQNIRWDITPKRFLEPGLFEKVKTDSYMLYVDIIFDKPHVVIMRMKGNMSKSVGYIKGVPDDLLNEALECDEKECKAGMYPLTKRLEQWLKNEFGLL